jgi:hypothetical protein
LRCQVEVFHKKMHTSFATFTFLSYADVNRKLCHATTVNEALTGLRCKLLNHSVLTTVAIIQSISKSTMNTN